MLPQDTIAAISTAPGRAGIGIVRLSGPAARSIGEHLLHLRHPLAPGRARLAHLLDPDPEPGTTPVVLDEVLATFFAAPRSYTGEDVLEIAAHGAPILLQTILRATLARGARLAEPGEFTHRAFLSGRLDLAQAEAVHDLVAATTLHQARIAASQLGGALAQQIAAPKADLITLVAALEAGIDFAEDDLDLLPDDHIAATLARVATPLRRLQSTFTYGHAVSSGLALTLVGAPNTGKSSLFNALLGRDRAIVTPVPGTTRDTLSEPLNLLGLPVHLTDTAGLRDTTDPVESLGIARSRSTLADSAAILIVLDSTTLPLTANSLTDLRSLLAETAGRPTLFAVNKVDLSPHSPTTLTDQLQSQIAENPLPTPTPTDQLQSQIDKYPLPTASSSDQPQLPIPILAVSALTGTGIPELRTALHQLLAADLPAHDTVVITSLRQQSAITAALTALDAATAALHHRTPHEMLLLDLHQTLAALDSLTGTTTTDAILDQIFSTFCIGK